jgi:hypothetical protein
MDIFLGAVGFPKLGTSRNNNPFFSCTVSRPDPTGKQNDRGYLDMQRVSLTVFDHAEAHVAACPEGTLVAVVYDSIDESSYEKDGKTRHGLRFKGGRIYQLTTRFDPSGHPAITLSLITGDTPPGQAAGVTQQMAAQTVEVPPAKGVPVPVAPDADLGFQADPFAPTGEQLGLFNTWMRSDEDAFLMVKALRSAWFPGFAGKPIAETFTAGLVGDLLANKQLYLTLFHDTADRDLPLRRFTKTREELLAAIRDQGATNAKNNKAPAPLLARVTGRAGKLAEIEPTLSSEQLEMVLLAFQTA